MAKKPASRKKRAPAKKRAAPQYGAPLPDQVVCTVKQFCALEPAFTEGGIRWDIFNHEAEMRAAGALAVSGRRRLLNRVRYLAYKLGSQAGADQRLTVASIKRDADGGDKVAI